MNDLVRRARSGERSAFESLYRENVGRVYAICLRMSADPVQAEELTQSVFIRAWERLTSFRGDSAFSSWLHRLAINVIFQESRGDRRRLARVQSTDDPEILNGCPSGGKPEVHLDLEESIRRLPAGARQVFVLHDVEGYRHHEIAEMIGIAVGTSKAHLHRARRLLREMMG